MMEDIISHLKLENYEYWRAGKTITKPFAKDTRAKFSFQVINYDICGPINVRARHDDVYFITFIDDFTRYGYVFFISHKSEALSCFIKFINLVENQLDMKIRILRINQGCDYLSYQFRKLYDEKGIE
jgi:transposase InsO family protein